MDIVVMLLTLAVIIFFLLRRIPLPSMEEMLHLVSTEDLELARIPVIIIRESPLHIAHFILCGPKMICGYGCHQEFSRDSKNIVVTEFLEIVFAQSLRPGKSVFSIKFQDGQPIEWKIGPKKEFRCPINGHERWVLTQILATIQSAVDIGIKGAFS